MPHKNPKINKMETDTLAVIKDTGTHDKGKNRIDREVVKAAAHQFIANIRSTNYDQSLLNSRRSSMRSKPRPDVWVVRTALDHLLIYNRRPWKTPDGQWSKRGRIERFCELSVLALGWERLPLNVPCAVVVFAPKET